MTHSTPGRDQLKHVLEDVGRFSKLHPGYAMRAYQIGPARAIADAVLSRRGDMMAAVFSRQAGKDEMLAQLLAFLLLRFSRIGGSIVVGAPTQTPQALITRDRLTDRLAINPLIGPRGFRVSEGYQVHVGRAKVSFLSAAPTSNPRGQTADRLLVANEAQDITTARWDAAFDPMAASTNAPTLFMGTVWDSSGLLARQMRYLRELEHRDGRQRLFLSPWETVASEVPAYGDRVRERIDQLGEDHPFIRTEYCLQELDGDGGLFNAQRQSLMRGTHPRRSEPTPRELIAFLVDVAGASEDAVAGPGSTFDPEHTRDSTTLTIVSIDTSLERPSYRTVDRYAWTDQPWGTVQGAIAALARRWSPRTIIVDQTGIGFGMYTWLKANIPRPTSIEPFTFTSSSKSTLAWAWLALIESGRFQDYADDGQTITREWWKQVGLTTYEVLPGPNKLIRWGVDPAAGHDDLVMSAALVAELERLDPRPRVARGTPDR